MKINANEIKKSFFDYSLICLMILVKEIWATISVVFAEYRKKKKPPELKFLECIFLLLATSSSVETL